MRYSRWFRFLRRQVARIEWVLIDVHIWVIVRSLGEKPAWLRTTPGKAAARA